MAIDQAGIIDSISIDLDAETVFLSIDDHLDWENTDFHLFVMEEKISNYLAFIKNGQLLKHYPDAAGKKIIIEIAGQFEVPEEGQSLIKSANEIAHSMNVEITIHYVP